MFVINMIPATQFLVLAASCPSTLPLTWKLLIISQAQAFAAFLSVLMSPMRARSISLGHLQVCCASIFIFVSHVTDIVNADHAHTRRRSAERVVDPVVSSPPEEQFEFSLYLSGLPDDVTQEEIASLFDETLEPEILNIRVAHKKHDDGSRIGFASRICYVTFSVSKSRFVAFRTAEDLEAACNIRDAVIRSTPVRLSVANQSRHHVARLRGS